MYSVADCSVEFNARSTRSARNSRVTTDCRRGLLDVVLGGLFLHRDDRDFGVVAVFLLDDRPDGIGVAIAVDDQEFDPPRGERVGQAVRAFSPVAVRRVPGIAQRSINECNVVLVVTQDGDKNTVAPVQILVPVNRGRAPVISVFC